MITPEQNLFRSIFENTKKGKLKWSVEPVWKFSEIIFQPKTVFRIFRTEFEKSETIFTVLLVEKKVADEEWNYSVEEYRPEMYFLTNDILALTFGEEKVGISELAALAKLAEASSPFAEKLLGN